VGPRRNQAPLVIPLRAWTADYDPAPQRHIGAYRQPGRQPSIAHRLANTSPTGRMIGVNASPLMEPSLSVNEWWQAQDGRWFPPYDGKQYGAPQWHAPIEREPGLPVGKIRNPWAVVGLTLITLGIYRIYWEYRSFKDLKEFSGEGIGPGWGLVFAILVAIVNSFVLPSEIGRIEQAENKLDPVSGATGFWVILPLVGWIVWTVKVQNSLNDVWQSYAGKAVTA